MNKWNKKIGLAVLSLGLLTFAPSAASAQGYYGNGCCVDPCCDPCGCGGFEVGVDFLWWKPCVDDLDVAFTYSPVAETNLTGANVHYKTICPDWEPGVRVRLAKPELHCNWELGVSYTYIKPSQSLTANAPEGGFVGSTLLHADLDFDYTRVSGHWETTYQEFDILLGYPLELCQCQSFTPFFGVAGLFLDQELKSGQSSPLVTNSQYGSVKWKSDYWGVGLKVGTDYDYQICDGFSLIASGSATIVAGESDNHNSQSVVTNPDTTATTERYKFKDSEACHVIPGYHIAVGAAYDTCWCDWELGFRLGYEFKQWHNVANARRFLHDTADEGNERVFAQSTSPSTTTFGFHGLFAGLDFKF